MLPERCAVVVRGKRDHSNAAVAVILSTGNTNEVSSAVGVLWVKAMPAARQDDDKDSGRNSNHLLLDGDIDAEQIWSSPLNVLPNEAQ